MDSLILIFVALAVLLLAGVPIPFALGGASMAVIVYDGLPLTIMAQQAYRALDSFVMLAVPFFLFIGILMNASAITARLLEFTGAMFGRTQGALAKINVVVSMLFGGLSGSSVADVAGIGAVLIPAMIEEGYPRGFTVAITAASSTIGIIIPPSIFMVVYGAAGDVSIGAMFLGGAIPGVLIGLTQLAYTTYLGRKHGHPRGDPFSFPRLVKATGRGILPFGMTALIIGGIIWGLFTATEAAAVGVLYVLGLALFIYRSLSLSSFTGAINEAADTLGPTMLCVAMGSLFAWVLAYLHVPTMVEGFVNAMRPTPVMVLMFIMILFVIVGTFESGVASIIIFLPIVKPLGDAAGLHPVHVGVIVCMTLALGLITPPYGLCLFIAAKIGGMSVERAFVATLPWIVLFLAVDVACVVFPEIVLFLPKLVLPEFMGVK